MKIHVSQPAITPVHVSGKGTVQIGVASPVVERIVSDPYDGPVEVIPSGEAQTLATNGKQMLSDITVAPIPQNYGLITWNGSTLTVS